MSQIDDHDFGGTFARVLGTAPLAPDGSFYVEAPDRLMQFQVLDSDPGSKAACRRSSRSERGGAGGEFAGKAGRIGRHRPALAGINFS